MFPIEVVGVIGNTQHAPFTQAQWSGPVSIALRANGDPARLAGPVRAEIRALDPDQPVNWVNTMQAILAPVLKLAAIGVALGIA